MKFRLGHFPVFPFLFLLFLLLINAWIFFDRNNNYAYREVLDYDQLYADHLEITKWKHSSPYTSAQEEVTAHNILRDSMHIVDSDNSLIKIQKIGSYILSALDDRRGAPSKIMNGISPLEEFYFARNKKSEVWCGNFANIFSFFANQSGVLTRYVAQEGDKNNQHVFNECFVKESNQWVLVDLTYKLILAKNNSGNYLNAIDLHNAHISNTDSITVTTFQDNEIGNTNYTTVRSFYDPYFHRNSLFVFYLNDQFDSRLYSITSKLKRYLTKSATFVSYGEKGSVSNKKFYYKISYFYLLVAFTVCLIALGLVRAKGKRERG